MNHPHAQTIVAAKDAVIFDLFHTLVSVRQTWDTRRPMAHEILGVSREAWTRELEANLHDLYVGLKKDPITAVADMARAIDPAISNTAIEAAADSIVDTFSRALLRVPVETITVLSQLRTLGKRIGLVSNASVMEVTAWERSPIAPFFDSVIFSCFAGCVKPDREIYEMCLEKLAVRPDQTVFVGDGGSDELEGARNVGITAVMVAGFIRDIWPDKIEERRRQSDAMIESVCELISNP